MSLSKTILYLVLVKTHPDMTEKLLAGINTNKRFSSGIICLPSSANYLLITTVLSAKSDSDFMFCLQSCQG